MAPEKMQLGKRSEWLNGSGKGGRGLGVAGLVTSESGLGPGQCSGDRLFLFLRPGVPLLSEQNGRRS